MKIKTNDKSLCKSLNLYLTCVKPFLKKLIDFRPSGQVHMTCHSTQLLEFLRWSGGHPDLGGICLTSSSS